MQVNIPATMRMKFQKVLQKEEAKALALKKKRSSLELPVIKEEVVARCVLL